MNIEERIVMAIADLKEVDINIKHLLATEKELLWKPTANAWSAAQCVEHLVVSNSLYFSAFDEKITQNPKASNNKQLYKPSFWGKLIYNMVDPDKMDRKKSKTPKIFNPQPIVDIPTLVKRFEDSQERLLGYFEKLALVDASQKISSPASWFIKLTIVDALAILSKHEIRHYLQAKRVLDIKRKQ
jgi:DinB superfamily